MGPPLRTLFDEAIARVDPAAPTAAAIARLEVGSGPIVVLAIGKAAVAMARGADAALGPRIRDRVIVAPAGGGSTPDGVLVAAHPVPDVRSEAAGRALLAAAGRTHAGEEVISLVSGGGSALAAVPASGISLADKIAIVAALTAAGAPIGELNRVRRALSAIKG